VPIGEMAQAIREVAMDVAGLRSPAMPPGQG